MNLRQGSVFMENTGFTPIKIHLHTEISQDGETENFEIISFGRYYEKNGSQFITYEEVTESGKIKNVIKISNNQVLIMRNGAINMRFSLQKGVKTEGSFENQYGSFPLILNTNKIYFDWDKERQEGELLFSYELYMQHEVVGIYTLSFQLKKEETINEYC
jgi:uncharacterized beta-barrel protein YwiB (DUF1934 family)